MQRKGVGHGMMLRGAGAGHGLGPSARLARRLSSRVFLCVAKEELALFGNIWIRSIDRLPSTSLSFKAFHKHKKHKALIAKKWTFQSPQVVMISFADLHGS